MKWRDAMKGAFGVMAFAVFCAILFCILGFVFGQPVAEWLWPPPPRARRGVSMWPLYGALWGLIGGSIGGVLIWGYFVRNRGDQPEKPGKTEDS